MVHPECPICGEKCCDKKTRRNVATAFGGRGQKTKHETQVVSAPRPVYTAPNRPPEAAPREKKPKRQSIYANQNGGIANPKKGKRKRWGDPGGQF